MNVEAIGNDTRKNIYTSKEINANLNGIDFFLIYIFLKNLYLKYIGDSSLWRLYPNLSGSSLDIA